MNVYILSDESKKPTISDEHLRALCILTYSDNAELQRSAALCFAELSERSESLRDILFKNDNKTKVDVHPQSEKIKRFVKQVRRAIIVIVIPVFKQNTKTT